MPAHRNTKPLCSNPLIVTRPLLFLLTFLYRVIPIQYKISGGGASFPMTDVQ